MPTRTTEIPDGVKPYTCNGTHLDYSNNVSDAKGTCPFCGEDKLTIDKKRGVGRCWSCNTGNEKGGLNPSVFVEKLYELFDEQTEDYGDLAADRGIRAETLIEWGAAKSSLLDCWVLPGYNKEGKVSQLYRFQTLLGKKRMLATSGIPHGIFGMNLFGKKKGVICLCEGPWDAMRLWQAFRGIDTDEDGNLYPTSNRRDNLLTDCNVLAIPGCNVFRDDWVSLFTGKIVHLFFDNDHPRENKKTGKSIEPPAMAGLKRVAGTLLASEAPPAQVDFFKWGENGYDLDLADGYDLRDYYGP
jgi:hypothetical protein